MEQKTIPGEARGWNWGAFLLSWIWGLGNGVYVALLALIPIVGLVMIFILGAKGNAWAWKKKDWKSVEDFKNAQRKWRNAGWIVWGSIVGIILLGAMIDILSSQNNAPVAYQPSTTQAQSDFRTQPSPVPVVANQDTGNTLAMKQQCSTDGQKYFQSEILPNYTAQALNQEMAGYVISDYELKNTIIPGVSFAYNQAMNTCLIDFTVDETYYDYKGLVNSVGYWTQINDIYSNKAITDIGVYPDGSIGGYVGETQAIFDANEQNLMVNGEECNGGNGNC